MNHYNKFSTYLPILEKYIDIALDLYFPAHSHQKNKYNLRCNICGDSKKSKKKKRGWIIKDTKDDKPWMFHCFNCGMSMPVEYWLKNYFYDVYTDYSKELFNLNSGSNAVKEKIPVNVISEPVDEYNEFEDVRHFIPISTEKYDVTEIARTYCKERLIPEDVWLKWFVAVDGKFRNRLVIPFYDREGKIYSYQCRSLFDQIPKYLGRKNSEGDIYNYYNVNFDKPVCILEGMIDSLFIENAIAITGLKIYSEKLDAIQKKYFILDNDESGKVNSLKLLLDGKNVFIWSKFLRHLGVSPDASGKDDINSVVVKLGGARFTFENLRPFFTNSILDKFYFVTGGKDAW